MREQIDPQVQAIVFTHAHADHIMGLDDADLRLQAARAGPTVPRGRRRRGSRWARVYSYAFDERTDELHSRPQLEFVRIGLEPFELLGVTVRPFRLMHGRTPVLGFRVGDIAYATDCNAIPAESWPLLADLDTLVLDALWDEPHPTHFNVAQALEVIERVQPRRAFLTHVSHRLDYAATNARLPPHVRLSHDGLRLP
ncbi:MAG: MBL fold metallo-hydrolase [Planctomycetaceae bacterium]